MKKERLKHIFRINLVLIIVFIVYYVFNHLTGIYIPCIFFSITGLKCPGCGITHCLFEIIHLNFHEAFNHNQLVFIYLPFIITYYFYNTYLYLYDKKDKILTKIPNFIKIGIIIITLLFGIIRNL